MTRRIKKPLKDFFEKQSLTDAEKDFILGCINAQNKYPQLTHNTEELNLMDSTNQKDQVNQTKKVWCLQKKGIEFALSTLEQLQWGITTLQKRVNHLKQDMQETSSEEKCQLHSGLIKCCGTQDLQKMMELRIRSFLQKVKNIQKD